MKYLGYKIESIVEESLELAYLYDDKRYNLIKTTLYLTTVDKQVLSSYCLFELKRKMFKCVKANEIKLAKKQCGKLIKKQKYYQKLADQLNKKIRALEIRYKGCL